MNRAAKKFLSPLLVLCVVMGYGALAYSASAASQEFTDIPPLARYCDYVSAATVYGLFQGTSATTFSPERPLSRGEAMTVLGRAYEKMCGEKIPNRAAADFPDVPIGSFYHKYVGWAKEARIATGSADGWFRPDSSITQGELAVLFHRFLQFMGKLERYQPASGAYPGLPGFSARAQFAAKRKDTPLWVKPHIQAISGFEIFAEDDFDPYGTVTRGEAAALFVRMYQKATFPDDQKTPRQKWVYQSVWDEGRSHFAEAFETQAQILATAQEYHNLIAELEDFTREYTELIAELEDPTLKAAEEIAQPVPLAITEETFQDSNVLAVEIRVIGSPAYDCEFGGVGFEGKTARVTLIGNGQQGSTADDQIILFLALVPKEVVQAEVQHLSWTDYFYGYT